MENNETNCVPTASSICGVKTEPARLKGINQWEIYDVIEDKFCIFCLFTSFTYFIRELY
jgi:hypothetical protein